MRRHFVKLLFCLFSLISQSAMSFDIIAHRGASGYLPEHTLEAASLAYGQSPDYIEQDVVITKDGIPIVLHDIHLDTVTNVADLYPSKARSDERFYALDFTLAELQTLTVNERKNSKGDNVFPHRYQGTTAQFKIATLAEHFELITELNRVYGQEIGVYPEVKSPAWHLEQGVDASQIVIDTLTAFNLHSASAKSYLQCFDYNELKRVRNDLGYDGKLVMLIGENSWGESTTDYDWLRTPEGLRELANVVNGVGPWIGQLLDSEALARGELMPALWVKLVHEHKLTIHPYTFRTDALPAGFTQTTLLDTLSGVVKADGVFTDQVPPVKAWRASKGQ